MNIRVKINILTALNLLHSRVKNRNYHPNRFQILTKFLENVRFEYQELLHVRNYHPNRFQVLTKFLENFRFEYQELLHVLD